MSAADSTARAAFAARFKRGDRVRVADFGLGTIHAIGGNFAYVGFDADGRWEDWEREVTAGCRVVMFDRIEGV